MTMQAVRDFDSGKKYNEWKIDDKHNMFVRFVYHNRSQLAGQSDQITLNFSDMSSPSIDDELSVLPGLTTIENEHKE